MRSSTTLFLFSAFLFFVNGLLYLTATVQPRPDPVVNLSIMELAFYGSSLTDLTASLFNIFGINLFILSLLTVYIGAKAWQDSFAWITGLLYLLFYALPLTIVSALSSGTFLLAVLPVIPFVIGLFLALTIDREWKIAWPKWSSKISGGGQNYGQSI